MEFGINKKGEFYNSRGRRLNTYISGGGYLSCRGGLIHRLLAIKYIPNPKNKPCVNHKNGLKTDNRLENLEWVTYSENSQHAWDNGLYDRVKHKKSLLGHKPTKKVRQKMSIAAKKRGPNNVKLTANDMSEILKLKGISTQKEIAKKFNVSQVTISRALKTV